MTTLANNFSMERQTENQAMQTLYDNLYKSDLKHLDKNLDNLIKAKRILAKNQNKQEIENLEK